MIENNRETKGQEIASKPNQIRRIDEFTYNSTYTIITR